MHPPPPPLTLGEDPRQFVLFFLVDFLGYTPRAHDAWEAGHFCFPSWAGSVVERYPPLPLAGMVWHAWPRRTARAWVLGHFLVSFSCLMDAWLRL